MTGPEALQELRDSLIEVLNDTNGDPSPATGYANSRQIMNQLVQSAKAASDPTLMVGMILNILGIPDAPPESD